MSHVRYDGLQQGLDSSPRTFHLKTSEKRYKADHGPKVRDFWLHET